MKIMVCGSMRFAHTMLKTKKELERLGHSVNIPADINLHIKNPGLVDDLDLNLTYARNTDIMRECFNLIAESDSILVLNMDRGKNKGYIGTSSLMEIGLAYFLKKKIFLFNLLPRQENNRWTHEVTLMNPIIIEGDLKKIKE
jgi:hypothetical protein